MAVNALFFERPDHAHNITVLRATGRRDKLLLEAETANQHGEFATGKTHAVVAAKQEHFGQLSEGRNPAPPSFHYPGRGRTTPSAVTGMDTRSYPFR